MSALAFKMAGLALLPKVVRSALMRRRFEKEVSVTGEAEMPYLSKLLKRDDLALDVGCNLGSYAYALGAVTGRVVAFEPNPVMARFLRSLGLAGVEIQEIAASDSDGTAQLHIPVVKSGHALATLQQESSALGSQPLQVVSVRTARLDSLTFPSVVKFVKIDVEGHEEAVLNGAQQLLSRDKPALLIEIEERYNPGGLSRILGVLEPIGYSGFFLDNNIWHEVSAFDADVHQAAANTENAHRIPRRQLRYVNNFLFLNGRKNESFEYLSSIQ